MDEPKHAGEWTTKQRTVLVADRSGVKGKKIDLMPAKPHGRLQELRILGSPASRTIALPDDCDLHRPGHVAPGLPD